MNSTQKQDPRFRRQAGARMAGDEEIHLSEIPALPEAHEVFPEKPSYLKYAFANPYNLTLFGGALIASVLTFNPLIGIAALGLEGLWLLHGSQSGFMQRYLWDPIYEKEKLEFEQKARMRKVERFEQRERERVFRLIEKEKQIQVLAMQNPSFAGDLLRREIEKTHALVNSFIDLASICQTYEAYLRGVDTVALGRQRLQYRSYLESASGAPKSQDMEINLAEKNLLVIEKRLERVDEISRYVKIAYGQLALIENSFQLIADQIVTMTSPSELAGQLDELMDGVDNIKVAMRESEQLFK